MAAASAAMPAAMLRLFGNLLMNRFSCCRNDNAHGRTTCTPATVRSLPGKGLGPKDEARRVLCRATTLQHSSHIHARSLRAPWWQHRLTNAPRRGNTMNNALSSHLSSHLSSLLRAAALALPLFAGLAHAADLLDEVKQRGTLRI